MNKRKNGDLYGHFSQILISALTGQARVSITILVYSAVAVLLLVYVSSQIYAGILTQEIATLSQERHHHKETLNRLTSDYVSLSSRARVSRYCESVLGMVEARDGSYLRFALKDGNGNFLEPVDFVESLSAEPDPFRFTLHIESERQEK